MLRLIAPLILIGVVPVPAAAQDEAPTVVTTGEAIVRRAPDRAFVTAAVESRARNPRDAQRDNAEAMTAVQQRILSSGIPKDAVRTLGYNIQQEFDDVGGRRVTRGYVARNAVEVRVDVLERVGDLLDTVVEAGATAVSGVRFDLQDRASAEREALRLAVVDARGRAEAAAAGAGRAIDRILKIDGTQRDSRPPIPMPMVAMREAAQAEPTTPVEGGEIEIRAYVTLTVSIK
jgi:uncharacterized protein YggE